MSIMSKPKQLTSIKNKMLLVNLCWQLKEIQSLLMVLTILSIVPKAYVTSISRIFHIKFWPRKSGEPTLVCFLPATSTMKMLCEYCNLVAQKQRNISMENIVEERAYLK